MPLWPTSQPQLGFAALHHASRQRRTRTNGSRDLNVDLVLNLEPLRGNSNTQALGFNIWLTRIFLPPLICIRILHLCCFNSLFATDTARVRERATAAGASIWLAERDQQMGAEDKDETLDEDEVEDERMSWQISAASSGSRNLSAVSL